MAVVDQKARANALARAHALEHHVEAEDLHILYAPTSITLDGDPNLRPIICSMELELARLTI
jgi:hypothetical protein